MTYPRGNLFIDGPAGTLECIVKESRDSTRWAVVSHPHPAHGGTMHNKVVYRMAKALHEASFNVLRYNFRGVGHSQGTYDEGRGEADDLRAVLDYVERERAAADLLLAGFSFGAWINAGVGCSDPRVSRLLHVGLAASFFRLDFLSDCDRPTAVIQGDGDQYGEWFRVAKVVATMPQAKLFRVDGANHFFEGKIEELEKALAGAIEYLGCRHN